MNLLPNLIALGLGIRAVKLLTWCLTRGERWFEHPEGADGLDITAFVSVFGCLLALQEAQAQLVGSDHMRSSLVSRSQKGSNRKSCNE